MKKLLALLMAGAMTLSLVACGTQGNTSKSGSTSSTGSSEGKPSVYMDIPQEYRSWDENGKNINFERLTTAENGIVAALRYEPAQIGVDIMKKGGNAIDAAVATALALTVSMPQMCGVAGGGFMTFYNAETKETVFLSFRETAPMFQTAEMWVQDEEGNVIGEHNMYGGLSVGVPGEVAGLYQALNEYGTMDWKDVIQPAIDLAKEGYLVTPELYQWIEYAYSTMTSNAQLSEIYLDENGMVKPVNSVITNKYMAQALEMIRDKGPEGFYQGAMADAMIQAVQSAGGVMTQADLDAYKPWEEPAVSGTYRGYTIASSASPSSGGTFIVETLNILENLPVYDFDTIEYWHQLAEVQKMVWADRGQYMGDTRFVDVPIDGIISKEYAKTLAAKVDMTKSQDFTYGNPWDYETESQNTTSFSVADKAGNMVSITHTINGVWGSRVYVDDYGFFMNNQLGDFVVGSGYSNSVEPGKCPLSSMSPTVVLDPDGNPFMTCGAPGGIFIYPGVCQVILNAIDHKMNIHDALNTPRIAAMGPTIRYDAELRPEMLEQLKSLGHTSLSEYPISMPTGIMYMPDGTLQGSAELTGTMGAEFSDGVAVGY